MRACLQMDPAARPSAPTVLQMICDIPESGLDLPPECEGASSGGNWKKWDVPTSYSDSSIQSNYGNGINDGYQGGSGGRKIEDQAWKDKRDKRSEKQRSQALNGNTLEFDDSGDSLSGSDSG